MTIDKNQTLQASIVDYTYDAMGIAKVNGMPFFIKDTVIGDEVEFIVTKLKKTYGYGKVTKIITPSADRCEPACNISKRCGGCQLQCMNYSAELRYKQGKVYENLRKIGGFSEDELKCFIPILGSDKEYHYRNKAQYPFGVDKEGKFICGFFAQRSHDIVSKTDCLLGAKKDQLILEAILEVMKAENVRPYSEETRKGVIRHVLIRNSFSNSDASVCFVINRDKLPAEQSFVGALKKIPHVKSIAVNVNKQDTNVILGDETYVIYGAETISDCIKRYDTKDFSETGEELKFEISPRSFFQVNPYQTGKLYSIALDFAGLTGNETVWDLYCGIGTISLFMAKKAKKVYGVEIIPEAIEDAKMNAKRNGIENAEFFVGAAEEVLPDFYKNSRDENAKAPDVICVDPPRKGCDEKCLETMIAMAPKKIVYVSCDSATLARDLKYLTDNGYSLEKVRPVDMFPKTVHVETVCLLTAKT